MNCSPRSKHYKVIYADPPWTFATYSDKGKGRSAEAHYDCMSVKEIAALPVSTWAADDAVLLLWATDPLLDKALEIIRAWGFAYKTVGFYWAKLNRSSGYPSHPSRHLEPEDKSSDQASLGLEPEDRSSGYSCRRSRRPEPEAESQGRLVFDENSFFTGLGFWTRANPEMCLLATRGKPKRKSSAVKKLVIAPRREHSRKPDEVYGRIESLCDGPYLEMFARRSRPGWDAWGLQGGLFDRGSVPTRRRPSANGEARRLSLQGAPE
jgi:N6-adenosine-specific RNA methylase IME4